MEAHLAVQVTPTSDPRAATDSQRRDRKRVHECTGVLQGTLRYFQAFLPIGRRGQGSHSRMPYDYSWVVFGPTGRPLGSDFSVPGSSEIHSWTRGAILCLCVTDFRRDSLDRQETCIGSLSMDLHEMAKAYSTEHDLQIQFLLGPLVQNLIQTWSATVSSGRTLGIMVTWHCVPGMHPSPHAPTVPGSRIGDPGIFGGRDEE